jgi:epoxyqueuosine reductase
MLDMSSPKLLDAASVKARALELGFDLCGIAPAAGVAEPHRLSEWLARGYGGRMTYLNRSARVRADIRQWLPSAQSVVVVASLYHTRHAHHVEIADPARARIARYAWGDDYHDVMGRRLRGLEAWMRDTAGPGFDARCCVDDGPVQEKAHARLAGIGWMGKNTCVISPRMGSWLLLGVLACNAVLEPDEPETDRCGTCQLCLEACPAGAFVHPYVLDARRCLSYLTIEVRGGIPAEQRGGLGAHVFGCDICQDVCPFNAAAPVTPDPCWQPKAPFREATLESLWGMDDAGLERAIAGTALRRAGVRGLRRNLAVAIGNAGPALARLLPDPGAAKAPDDTTPAAGAKALGPDTSSPLGAQHSGPDTASVEEWLSLDDPVVAEHIEWARARSR